MEEVKIMLSCLFLFLAIIFMMIIIVINICSEARAKKIDELTLKRLSMEIEAMELDACCECSCEDVAPDYKSMSVVELKRIAKERGISGYYNLKKDGLIKALSK